MTEENVNEEMQDDSATEPDAETTDAPEGRADAENIPVEQVPEGDVPGSADEAPEAAAEQTTDAASTEEPAEGPPAEEAAEPTAEPAAEEPVTAAESTEEPAEGSVDAVEESTTEELETAEAATGESGAPAAAAAPAAAPVKRKKKRLPRSLRPQRTKAPRERSAERKPIARLPKPEHERGRRQERQGRVVSANADKTIIVRVDVVKVHPMYKKVVKRSTKLHAHDEENQAKVGDVVRVVETRPLSKLKRWRLQEIIEEAK